MHFRPTQPVLAALAAGLSLTALHAVAAPFAGPSAAALGRVALGARPPVASTADLRATLTPGKEARYTVKADSAMKFKVMGRDADTHTIAELTIRVKVIKADSDGAVVELTHEAMKYTLKGTAVDGTFDSATPATPDEANTLAGILRPMIGKPLTLTLDAHNRIVSVADISSMAPSDQAGAIFNMLYGEDAVRSMYQPLFALKYEPSTAEKGESWTEVHSSMSNMGGVDRNLTLTLSDIRGGTASVRIEGAVALNLGNDPSLTKTEHSRVTGACEWSTADSLLQSLTSESSAKIVGAQKDFNITVEHESSTVLERVK